MMSSANLLPLSDQNLILTGYTGPNQPLLGRQIGDRLKMVYINLEQVVEERTGETLNEFRERFGDARLKRVEAEIISETVLRRRAVIRISGRTLLNSEHVRALQETGPVICLYASLDAVLQRLHLVLGARYHDPQERALALGHLKSEWAVRALPGVHQIDTTYMNANETVEAIIALWQRLAIRRG